MNSANNILLLQHLNSIFPKLELLHLAACSLGERLGWLQEENVFWNYTNQLAISCELTEHFGESKETYQDGYSASYEPTAGSYPHPQLHSQVPGG